MAQAMEPLAGSNGCEELDNDEPEAGNGEFKGNNEKDE